MQLKQSLIIQQTQTKSQHLTQHVTTKCLIKQVWYIGFIAYGGPLAHIAIFKKKFVDELQWIERDQFIQLTTICQSIPGPTSSQLLIAICLLKTNSIQGGILAWAIFSFPGFLFFIFIGLLLGQNRDNLFQHYQIGLKGFMTVATALVANAFWGLSQKYRKNTDSLVIILVSSLIYLYSQTILSMLFILFGSSLYSYFFKKITFSNNNFPPKQSQSISIINHSIMGKRSAILFLFFLLVAIMTPLVINTKITNEISIFYRIGSIIIGGGHVVLPMLWNQLKSYDYMTQDEFYHGFSIVSCLPGPMFNLTSYIGFIINGIIGSFICTFGINFPAVLSLFSVMPYWNQYRSNQKVQKILDGLCCGSLGLILAAVAFLWKVSIYNSSPFVYITNTILSLFSLFLLCRFNLPIIILMIIAAIIQYLLYQIHLSLN